MSRRLVSCRHRLNRSLGIALLFSALIAPASATGVIEEIWFESGSIGAFGTPAASGWQFQDLNFISRVEPVFSSNRTFSNGNNEALLINPFNPDESGDFRLSQGAFWELQHDGGGTAEVIDADEIFYTVWEHFSDVARSRQEWKTQAVFGLGGGAEDGFDLTPGNATDVTWTWGDNARVGSSLNNGIWGNGGATWCGDGTVACQTMGGEFSGTRYGTPVSPSGAGGAIPEVSGTGPEPADLDLTHTSTVILRSVFDGETAIGTEQEINDTNGVFNGGDSGNRRDVAEFNDEWGGHPAISIGKTIDRAAVAISRHRDVVNPATVTSSWIDVNETDPFAATSPENAQIGIKYLRFGTAKISDFNLDGVTDDLDKAIIESNIGIGPDNNPHINLTGATFFDGDFDNDLDVDDDDLTAWCEFVGGCDVFTPGDFDKNGQVDGDDFLAWQSSFGTMSGAVQADGDADGDGDVDGDDFLIWQSNFGTGTGGSGGSSVPEPAAGALVLLGLTSLLGSRQRAS